MSEARKSREPTEAELTNEEAVARVCRAMVLIEDAQNLLAKAAQELCPVVGASSQHDRVSKLYERVKAQWYVLEAWLPKNKRKLDLDGVNKEAWRKMLSIPAGHRALRAPRGKG